MTATLELKMAQKDNQVRLDDAVLAKARIVAVCRGVPLTKYLSDLLRESVDRDHAEEIRKQSEAVSGAETPKPKARPKGRR